MQNQIFMSNIGVIFFMWVGFTVISAIISSNKKKKMERNFSGQIPPQQFQNQGYPQQRGYQQNVSQVAGSTYNQNISQMKRREYVPQNNQYQEYVPNEHVEEYVPNEYVEEYVPNEYVEEYVPVEFGESGSKLPRDDFYLKMETVKALHDEEDIAREKAYQRKTQNAFAKNETKKISRAKQLFSGQTSLKKAILVSEILEKPKAIEK